MLHSSEEIAEESSIEMDGRLNIAERMVACVGAWAGSLAARCQPPAGPFFMADGRLICASAFCEQDGADQEHRRPL